MTMPATDMGDLNYYDNRTLHNYSEKGISVRENESRDNEHDIQGLASCNMKEHDRVKLAGLALAWQLEGLVSLLH
jgi:hypothetical protein